MSDRRSSSVKTLFFLFSFLKPHQGRYFLGAVLGAFEIAMTLLLPTIYQQITLLVKGGNEANVMRALLMNVLVMLLLTPLVCWGSYIQRSSAAKAKSRLQKSLFSHMQRQPLANLQKEKIGGLLTLLSNDAQKAMSCLTNFSNVCLFRFFVLFGCSALSLFLCDWRIAALAFAMGLSSFLVSVGLSPKTRAVGRKAQEYAADSAAFLLDSLRGLPIIRVFALYPKRASEYAAVCDRVVRYRVIYRVYIGVVDGIISVIQYVTQPLALLIGIRFVIDGSMAIDQAVLSAGMASVMAEAFYSLSQFVSFVQDSLVSGQRIQDELAKPVEAIESSSADVDLTYPMAIEVRNVGFHYPQGAPVLIDVHMVVPSGSKTVILGGSGGGKTTLLKLLECLYEATKGELLYYGQSRKDLSIRQIRSLCAYVPQECTLFEGTIGDNIALGRSGCSRAEVEEAARNAQMSAFIVSLPYGYDTPIGERGLQLSGGQRQRIAIARAFIRNAPILLLDEATASLDARSEDAVLSALDQLMEDKTVIQLSHRHSVVLHSDQVLSLENGCLSHHAESVDAVE